MRVVLLVVGMGSSAAYTSTELIGHATKVYLSHRAAVKVVRRTPFHSTMSSIEPTASSKSASECLAISSSNRQKDVAKSALDKHSPSLSRWLFDYTIEHYSKKKFLQT